MIDLTKPLELSDGTPVFLMDQADNTNLGVDIEGYEWVRVQSWPARSSPAMFPGLSPETGAAFRLKDGTYNWYEGEWELPVLRNVRGSEGYTVCAKAGVAGGHLSDTLKTRGHTYGSFSDNSQIAHNIKQALRWAPRWNSATSRQKEAADQIASKLSRLFSGTPGHEDSWLDIAGYATLAAGKEPAEC